MANGSMKPISFAFLITCSLLFHQALRSHGQPPDPGSPSIQTLTKFVQLLERRQIDVNAMAKQVLAEENFDQLKQQVLKIRQQVANTGSVDVSLDSATTGTIEFSSGNIEASPNPRSVVVRFEMTNGPPVRIQRITVTGNGNDQPNEEGREPITWENLESELDAFAESGFDGAVLVTRNGEVVLHKAYGFANREKKIRNSTDTIFAIGSQPIDFTHVAILKLKDQGKLDLNDPITRFFNDVPADKQSITIRHLMTGRSGFPDFHDRPADANKDHTWIDRDEAVRRMLNHQLLFEPGTDQSHSHSAWGMLAAIVEIVSGESYRDFAHKHLFEPAGMKDTGFFGDSLDEDRVAVGYGERQSSDPNSPDHWGKTSWLVMGSGGQVSTLSDMLKWEQAVKSGKLLSPESTQLFLQQHGGVAADGDMFGFEFVHSSNPNSMFLLISNSIDSRQKRQRFTQMGRRLAQLVQPSRRQAERVQRSPAKFSLGILMGVTDQGIVEVTQVVPGGAASQAGLQVKDRLIKINGQPMTDDPLSVLGPVLQNGDQVLMVVERNGKQIELTVKPLPREGG